MALRQAFGRSKKGKAPSTASTELGPTEDTTNTQPRSSPPHKKATAAVGKAYRSLKRKASAASSILRPNRKKSKPASISATSSIDFDASPTTSPQSSQAATVEEVDDEDEQEPCPTSDDAISITEETAEEELGE